MTPYFIMACETLILPITPGVFIYFVTSDYRGPCQGSVVHYASSTQKAIGLTVMDGVEAKELLSLHRAFQASTEKLRAADNSASRLTACYVWPLACGSSLGLSDK